MKFKRKISSTFIWTLVFTMVFSNFAGVLNFATAEASTINDSDSIPDYPNFRLSNPTTVVDAFNTESGTTKYDFKNIQAGTNGLVGYYYDSAKELTFPDWEKSVVMGYYNPVTNEKVDFKTFNYTYSNKDTNQLDFVFNGEFALFDNINQVGTTLYNVTDGTSKIIPTNNNVSLDPNGKLILTDKYAIFNDTSNYGAIYNLETGELKYRYNMVSSIPYTVQPSGDIMATIYLNNNAIELYDLSQPNTPFIGSVPLVRENGSYVMNVTSFELVDNENLVYAETNSGEVTWHLVNINTKEHTTFDWTAKSIKDIHKTYLLGDDNTIYSVKDDLAFQLEFDVPSTSDITMNDVGFFATNTTTNGETLVVKYNTNPDLLFHPDSLLTLLNELVQDLSTQDKILNAQSVLDATRSLGNRLTAEQLVVLEEELKSHQYTIVEAQVDLIELTASDLSTQSKINQTNEYIDIFNVLVEKLEDGTPKTDLINRVSAVKLKLDIAQNGLYEEATRLVNIALTTQTEEDVNTAYQAVLALPDGAQKQNLLTQLNTISIIEAKNIEAGNNVSLVLFPEGNVQSLGNSSKGQLEKLIATNKEPLDFSLTDIKKVDTSQYATFVLLNNGDVYGVGSSYYDGILGHFDYSNPTLIKLPVSNVKDIAAGSDHILFQLEDGSVKGMGSSSRGQLGNGSTYNTTPVVVPVTNVKNIAAGHQASYFILQDGTTVGLGGSSYGNLGNGTYSNYNPVQIPINNVKKVAAGRDFALFLLRDNTVVGLGTNGYGQLLGNNNLYTTPHTLPINNVKDIEVGYSHALFHLEDNTVVGSGYSPNGELGQVITKTTNPINIPVQNVSQVSAGYHHSLYLLDDGSIKGSGESSYGELGNTNYSNLELVVLPINLNGNLIAAIEQNIVELENLVPTIDTNEELSNARALVSETEGLLTDLPEGDIKTALQTRLDNVITQINNAEFAIQVAEVQKEMKALEDLINNELYNQTLIDQAEAQYSKVSEMINALKDSPEKTELLDRLNNARINIDAAIIGLQISELESTLGDLSNIDLINMAQSEYDELLALVNSLPDSPAKTELLNRLKTIQEQIDTARKNLELGEVTTQVNDLKTTVANLPMDEQAILDAEQELAAVKEAVNALPPSPEKDQLLEEIRLAEEQIAKTKLQMEIERIGKLLAELESTVNTGLTTQDMIDNARSKWEVILNDVSLLPEVQEKIDFLDRLNVLDGKINQAQKDYSVAQVEREVEKAEQLVARNLYSQELINEVQAQIDLARGLVDALPYEDSQLLLNERLDKVQADLDYAIAHIDVAIARKAVDDLSTYMKDGLLNQSMIDEATSMFNSALELVRALPESADKDELLTRLASAKHEIDLANAKNSVTAVEQLVAGDLSTYELIGNAQTELNNALSEVSKLQEGLEKDNLLQRLAVAQERINRANDQLNIEALNAEVEKVEALANGDLSTQELIDYAQSEHDRVLGLVNALNDGVSKTDFSTRLQAAQELINQAQYILDLDNATKAVVNAELLANGDLSTQALVDNAQTAIDNAYAIVNTLPSGEDKTALISRLDALAINIDNAQTDLNNQKLLNDATLLVEQLEELANGDLSNQDAIDQLQGQLNEVLETVNALPSDVDNSSLLDRINNVQTTIDNAQTDLNNQQLLDEATRLVEELEQLANGDLSNQDAINQLQDKLNQVLETVNALPSDVDNSGLLDRITNTQTVIDNAQEELNNQKLIDDANAKLAELNDLINSGLTNEELVKQAEDKLAELQDLVNQLPEGPEKDALLSEIQKQTNAIEQAKEELETQKSVDSANDIISNIEDLLQDGLTSEEEIANAEKALQDLKDIVNGLPEGDTKSELEDIISNLEEQIKNAKDKFESSNPYADIHAILDKVLSRDLSTYDLIEEGILEFKYDILVYNGVKNPTEEQIINQQVNDLKVIISELPSGKERDILLAKYDKAFDRLALETIDLLTTKPKKEKDKIKYNFTFPILNGVLDFIQDNSKDKKAAKSAKEFDYNFNSFFVPGFNSWANNFLSDRYKSHSNGKFEQFSPIILDHLVQYAIKETNAKSYKKDKGKVISYLSPLLKDKATGKQIQDVMEKYLK